MESPIINVGLAQLTGSTILYLHSPNHLSRNHASSINDLQLHWLKWNFYQ
jgi:hypothetical protein